MQLSSLLKKTRPYATRVLFVFLCISSVVWVRNTFYNGKDFEVFYRAARFLVQGDGIYNINRDLWMSFKYPPWIAPLFVPFLIFTMEGAKLFFGLAQSVAIVYLVWFLIKKYNEVSVAVVTLLFWGLWMVHTLDGQINIFMVMLFLVASKFQKIRSLAVFALTAKIFTLLALLGGGWRLKSLVGAAVLAGVFVLPVVLMRPQESVSSLFQDWKTTAQSGGSEFQAGKIRGRENQGLPAAVLRVLQISSDNKKADLIAFWAVFCMIGIRFWVWTRKMPEFERMIIWLGFVPVFHPLAWFHVFVFAFPLAVLAIDTAFQPRQRSTSMKYLAVLGVLMMTVMTEKTMGPLGQALELISVKSLGVILCVATLAMQARQRYKAASRAS